MSYSIEAKELEIGKGVRIGEGVKISFSGGPAEKIVIGDGVYLGHHIEVDCPIVEIGDYTMIREYTQILGNKKCEIGSCCWIGQYCIINSTANLRIGNGVGIGAHSQLWTHMRFGDTLQGCKWDVDKEMLIEDDVWFVGHCLVSPIHAKRKSMAMLGSVVTKDMEENHIYAGVPARDVTEKLGTQYENVSVDQKYAVMNKKLEEFYGINPQYPRSITIVKKWPEKQDPNVTYFNVSDRTYTKRLTEEEIEFMKFLLMKIKFYPSEIFSY